MQSGDFQSIQIEQWNRAYNKDHSYVQREIDAGRMTEAEAEVSPQRSVILQCIGASDDIFPDFFQELPVLVTALFCAPTVSDTK